MNIDIKDVSTTRKSMAVSLTKDEVAAEHKAVLAEYMKHARLPGFRPGKAPAAMVQRQFGKQIDEEFKQRVASKAYRDGIKESKLDVLTITDIQTGDIKPDADATITVTVDVRPEFELPDYNELPTAIAPTDPTDEEIDAAINALRSESAKFEVSQGPAKKGDYIKLSYEGTLDDKPLAEIVGDKQIYAKAPTTWEEVEGEHEGVIPGLGKHLADVKPGDKKTVPATYPEQFEGVPALAGKTVNYAIEVQEIRTRELPALDEEFFKTQNVENLDALKTRVREGLKSRKEYENRQSQRRQITDTLIGKTEFEVPASLLEDETQGVLRNIVEDNMRRGVPEEELEKNKKELYESAQKSALIRAKTRLILAKIAEKEDVKVDEKDIDAFIYREAMMTRQSPDKLVKELTKDQSRLRAVQQAIIIDKALDLVVSKAKISLVTPKA
ncbi:trigger factor [Ereboglobus sp. PH5-5]|uniref:trigger factor n=1 Tax=Ereboglobus sp. PH5-5 TaxID=2940529 RepID=UPI002406F7A3|nr:trigger factor [Ereboglobus sp. PH5-5]MDF9833420.1 trigger factor [Ereboglobus sp. PH5-5]